MANNKNEINTTLNAITNVATKFATDTMDAVSSDAQELKSGLENLSDNIGSIYDPQGVENGIKTISKKMDGTVDGGSVVEIVEGVPSLNVVDNISDAELTINDSTKSVGDHISSLLGTTGTTKTLNFQALGGESFAAINESIETGIAKVKGLKDSIVESISTVNDSASNVLNSLQESVEFGGIKELVVESGNITRGVEVNDITKAVEDVDPISSAINDITKAATDIFTSAARITVETGGGLLQDIAEGLSNTASSVFRDLSNAGQPTTRELSSYIQSASGTGKEKTGTIRALLLKDDDLSVEMEEIIKETEGQTTGKDFSDAVVYKARARGVPESEISTLLSRLTKIETAINNTDTTISGTIPKSNADFFKEEKNLRELSDFDYVDSIEELSGEFRTVTRDVTECIIHSSDTYTNQNIGSIEINEAHIEDDFDGIQFHYVIRRDGRIQRGKPVNKKSDASKINGHESHTIDVCMVGGINAPSGTENPAEYLSEKSYTIRQWQSLKLFLWAFYTRFPGGIVMGYGDIDATSTEPYFDVIEYVREGFGKVNPYDNSFEDAPLTGSDIVKKRVEIF